MHKPNKPDKPDKPNIWVRHDIPRGFVVPQFGMARAKMCRKGNATGRFTAGVCKAT